MKCRVGNASYCLTTRTLVLFAGMDQHYSGYVCEKGSNQNLETKAGRYFEAADKVALCGSLRRLLCYASPALHYTTCLLPPSEHCFVSEVQLHFAHLYSTILTPQVVIGTGQGLHDLADWQMCGFPADLGSVRDHGNEATGGPRALSINQQLRLPCFQSCLKHHQTKQSDIER